MISAVFPLIHSARQPSDDDNSSSGTLSLPTKPHFRSRSLPHRSRIRRMPFGLICFQFGNEVENLAIEFHLCDGQCRVATYQQSGVVFVAKQSKLGSLNIAILSSVSFNRQASPISLDASARTRRRGAAMTKRNEEPAAFTAKPCSNSSRISPACRSIRCAGSARFGSLEQPSKRRFGMLGHVPRWYVACTVPLI
jgi:hypothetical protein